MPETMMLLDEVPKPDFERLDCVLRRRGRPDRVPFYELFSNIENEVLHEIGNPCLYDANKFNKRQDEVLIPHITYQYYLGYDYINIREDMTGFLFPRNKRPETQTAQGMREYMSHDTKTITNRDDFDKYEWPDMSSIDYSYLERASALMPEGMKIIGDSPGIFENVFWLLGYEGLCYLIYDDPGLFEAMLYEVGIRVCSYFETLASYKDIGALRYGEDMGFKTQTLLAPDILRKYLFPWHKRIIDIAHKYDKPIILHSCGNLSSIMEEIISIGWDARHSFEDEIEPVWIAKQKYGSRISLLGGFDINKLSLFTEDEIRSHTRFLIDQCAADGGWALGSGNSIPNYIPIPNLLAMLDEGFLYGCR